MTAIAAKVLAVDNLGTQYRAIVRIGFPRSTLETQPSTAQNGIAQIHQY